MVGHPRDYPWSSYRCNGEGKANEILTPHDQYCRLAKKEQDRRKAYRALFKAHKEASIDDQIRTATNGNYVLGTKRFQEQVANTLGRRVIKGKAGRPRKDQDIKLVSSD